jgi:hypothetical protein
MTFVRVWRFALLSILVLGPLASGSALAELDRDDVAAAVSTALSGHAGPLVTHYDPALQMLVVVDGERRTAAVYSVSRGGIELVGRNDLDPTLMAGGKPPATMLPAGPPSRDVPAGDLPDLPLPAEAVRTSYSKERSHRGLIWRVSYVVRGEVPDLYAELRAQMDEWTVIAESVSSGSRARAEIEARRGHERLELSIQPARHPSVPGHVRVHQELVREGD